MMTEAHQKIPDSMIRHPKLHQQEERQFSKEETSYALMKIQRLSLGQRELIKKTFNEAKKNSAKNGTIIFVRLLAEYPEYKKIWPQFRSVADSAIILSDAVKRHAAVYMQGLETIINSIDDELELTKQLRRIAKSHLKWKIGKQHLLNMVPEVIAVMKLCNDNCCTSEIEESWRLLYEIIGDLIEFSKNQEK